MFVYFFPCVNALHFKVKLLNFLIALPIFLRYHDVLSKTSVSYISFLVWNAVTPYLLHSIYCHIVERLTDLIFLGTNIATSLICMLIFGLVNLFELLLCWSLQMFLLLLIFFFCRSVSLDMFSSFYRLEVVPSNLNILFGSYKILILIF